MDVCIPVIKCRKQETSHRCLHQPVTDPVFNHIGSGIIAQTCLLKLRDSELKDDGLIEEFYDRVIANFDYAENYYIILIHWINSYT